MKLTAEQMMDVTLALQLGLQHSAWEGLERPWTEFTREQQQAILAEIRKERALAYAAWSPPEPRLKDAHTTMLASLDVDAVKRAQEEEPLERERWRKSGRTGKPTIGGWKQAMNDILSQAVHFSPEQMRAVNRRLAAKKLPLLRELSGKLDRLRAGILKRGKIRNEAEFYVVKEIVCDQASPVAEIERTQFEQMLDAFEAGQKPRTSD